MGASNRAVPFRYRYDQASVFPLPPRRDDQGRGTAGQVFGFVSDGLRLEQRSDVGAVRYPEEVVVRPAE